MKKMNMLLTAAALLSLQSTSYCSEGSELDDNIQAPTLTRVKSHDGTRDGMFGSGLDTLTKLGTSYGEQVYAPGSDDQAYGRWAEVGSQIKTLDHAQKYTQVTEERGWIFTAESMTPSQSLIDTENQRVHAVKQAQLEEADAKYIALNQVSKAALKAVQDQKSSRKYQETVIREKFMQLQQEALIELNKSYEVESAQLLTDLTSNFSKLKELKETQNSSDSSIDYHIRRAPFTPSGKLTSKDVSKLARQYSNWSPKAKTFAEAAAQSSSSDEK